MKNYKNFTTKNVTHKEGFVYIDIRDENEEDWYELQKEFQEDTIKILYYSDTKMLLGYNKDVSMLAPFENTSIIEIKEMPEFDIISKLYVLEDKFQIVKLSKFEKIKGNKIIEDLVEKKEYYRTKQQELQRKFLNLKREKEEFLELGFNTDKTEKEIKSVTYELKEIKKIIDELEK